MEHSRIEALKIVHPELYAGEYRLLADFFRLCGSFVSECTLKEDATGGFDTVLVIRKEDFSGEQLGRLEKFQDRKVYVGPLDLQTAGLPERKQYITGCLDQIYADGGGDESGILKDLAGIYVDNGLMAARCSSFYLYDCRDIVEDAQGKYVDAYIAVKTLLDEKGGQSKYVKYARLNLARMLNETNRFLGERFLFDQGKLRQAAEQLRLESDGGFTNAYILAGMIGELEFKTVGEAMECYKSALNDIKGKEYASYANYRVGRLYEKEYKSWDIAAEYYTTAFHLAPHSHRAMFKLGMYSLENGKPDEAVSWFSRIINKLNVKKENNYLQQREYEYLHKSYCKIGEIYEKQERYADAADRYQSAIDIMEMTKKDVNRLYQEIFGGDAQKYLKLLRKKWPLDMIWERLMVVFTKQGRQEESMEYYKKLERRWA